VRSELLLTRKKKKIPGDIARQLELSRKGWVIEGKTREVVIISRASHRAWQMWSLNASRTDTHRAVCCIRDRHWEDPIKCTLFYSHPLQLLKVSGSSSLALLGPFEYDHNQNAIILEQAQSSHKDELRVCPIGDSFPALPLTNCVT